jgi:Fe-Mn family superoxide dismutase
MAQAQAPAGPHRLPSLPYAFDANEAAVDAHTMELHWRFHHGAQVNNLNAAIREHTALHDMPLDRLLMNLGQVPEGVRTAVRNNAGGHANHTMFWLVIGGRGGEPTGELAQAIAQDFADFATFRTRFNAAANGVFGSGWAFVTVNPQGRLAIVTRPN